MVIQKCEKSKKNWIFCKNWLTLFVSVREKKKRAFSCTLSVLAKNFFGPKTVQTRKNYKNSGFSGNCPKPKMTPFFGKGCFLTCVKKWVLLTVFFKSCASWKHYFYSVFSKTQLFKNKNCMLKKTENIWKIVGCSWTRQNGVFWVCFFWGFSVIVVCFWCVWHSSRSVKNACFSQFFGFLWGGLFLLILGLEGLGVFVFLVFVFVFLCCFCFCFVCFVFVFLLDWFWCWFLFCFRFCYFFVFFVLVLFFVFVVFCFFVVLFLLEGLRVRWGGPKSHLTWP